ncbi:MAG: DUF1573 domain-containing protein [Planctomycetota bacterium]
MTAKRSILTIITGVCVLMLAAGCEEETVATQQLNPYWFRQFEVPAEQPPVQATAAQSVTRPQPKITFAKLIHDFGDVGLKNERLCEFRFTNTGDGVLKIAQVTKSCDACTAFQLDKGQYEPGESGTLKVKFYSDTQMGQMTKSLTIRTNDPTSPDVVVAVKANVISKVDFEPKSLKLLLQQANAGCPKITLTSTDGEPFSIRHFISTDNCITADFDPTVKALKFEIEPKIDMARLANNLDGRIEIGLTHPECETVTVNVRTVPRFKISPILARGVRPGEIIARKVRVVNNYNENFGFASISSKNGTANVVNRRAIGNGYELEVEIEPPLKKNARFFSETLVLETTVGERLEIPCNVAFAAAEPPKAKKTSDKCKTCGPRVITSSGVNARDF